MSFRHEWGTFSSLWFRDAMRLKKERSRWFGVVLQPLVFWLVIGSGMSRGFQIADLNEGNYLQYFFPGTIVLSILFTTIFSVITVIEDRQAGFLQSVLVAPGSRLSLVLGKTAGVLTIVLLQVACFLAVAPFAGFPFASFDWIQFFAFVILGTVSLTALNFAMAWIMNSSQAYHAVMSIILIPLWIMSGAMFPLKSQWVDAVMLVNPIRYLVDGLRIAMGSEVAMPATTTFALMAISAVVFLLLSTFVLNRTRSEAL